MTAETFPGVHARARTLGGQVTTDQCAQRSRFTGSIPDAVERERLAATLGKELRGLRSRYGLSTRGLAERSALARSTILRLESGGRRPRPVTLEALAYGFDHKAPEALADALKRAAGPSLRPDSEAGRKRYLRRKRKARRDADLRRARVFSAATSMASASVRAITVDIPRLTAGLAGDLDALEAALTQMERTHSLSRRLDNASQSARSWLREAEHPLDLQRIRYAEWSIEHGNR